MLESLPLTGLLKMTNTIRLRVGTRKLWGWEVMGGKKLSPKQKIANITFEAATMYKEGLSETGPAVIVTQEERGEILDVVLGSNAHNAARVQINTLTGKFRIKQLFGNDFVCVINWDEVSQ